MAKVRVFHTHGLQGVLERVKEAVIEVVKRLAVAREELKDRIERLQEIQLIPKKREEWLKRLFETLPRKYHSYLMEQWRRNRKEFGETAEAVFQTITALVPRVRNEEVRSKLNKYAQEVLAVATHP
jgi:ribonuclease I